MKFRSVISFCAATFAVVLLTGCAAVVVGGAAGVGTYAYLKGELKVSESASLDRCWKATEGAMKDLEFRVTTNQKDALRGWMVARTATDKKVEIDVIKVSDTVTELRVRVGTFGNESLSRMIIEKIEKRL